VLIIRPVLSPDRARLRIASTPPFFQSIASPAPLTDSSPPHSPMSHSDPGHLPECARSPSYTATVTSTFPSPDSSSSARGSSPSDEEGLTEHLPAENLWSSVQLGIGGIRHIKSDFKYRVWFTWRLLKSSSWNVARLGVWYVTPTWREEGFWRSVARADPDEDIWFWEAEDEEYIKAFIEDHPGNHFHEMSEVEWNTACLALRSRARDRQRQRSSSLSHLTPEARIRFMTWLVVAAVYPKEYQFRRVSLSVRLQCWRLSISKSQLIDSCGICRVSDHLDLWIETMLYIYSVDDLQLIPWDRECRCFQEWVPFDTPCFSRLTAVY
jgi:hypothetical protein